MDVAVIGLGRIGLPTALVLERSGFRVTGIDTDEVLLNKIRAKTLFLDESDIQSLLNTSRITVSNQPTDSDIFLICVPTPLTPQKKVDLSHLQNAIAMIQPFLKKGNLVIIESTCPIGTTEKIASHFPGVYFAYSPERVMPGNLLKELIECDRTVGGVDEKATEKAIEFYRRFCRGKLYKTQSKMAELVKLSENAYRNVNIALANELSMLAEDLGLCPHELITLTNRHPRVDILKPGIGVGGHCIPVDPMFLIETYPNETTILQVAQAVNERKRAWIEKDIEKKIKRHRCRTIALFGLTYKANTSDFRNSPALAIYESLKKKYRVIPIDPFYQGGFSIQKEIQHAEMIIGLVAHDAFRKLDKNLFTGKIILDYAEVFIPKTVQELGYT